MNIEAVLFFVERTQKADYINPPNVVEYSCE